MSTPGAAFQFCECTLDAGRRVLERGGEPVNLQPKVFDTLHFLVLNPDRVVTKDEFFARLWPNTIVSDDVLTRVIRELRKALADDARSPRFIEAVRGVGYRFVARVECSGSTAPRSIAVMPFRAVTSEVRDESLELGLADTLIARLSALPELIVRPLEAARRHREGTEARDLARELGVGAFVEASLQASGERLRVNVRLISTDDGTALWSGSFDERFADVFAVQDAIAARVVDCLLPHLTDSAAAVGPTSRPPEAAYREYLEGRLFLGRHTPGDVRRAMGCFERALASAPDYVEAMISLGECHELLATESESDAADNYVAARRCARRALELRPGSPAAECLLAKIAWQHDWDWGAAEAAFRRALDLRQNRADVRTAYSDFCSLLGRVEEGLEHAQAAVEIDPVSPWSNAILAQALYQAGRYREAVTQAGRVLELAPGFAFGHMFAGLAEFVSGNHEQGIAHLETAVRSGRRDFEGALAMCYGRVGREQDASRILDGLLASGDAPPIATAIASLGCGDIDTAVACLEQCFQRKQWHLLLLYSDPLFAEVRVEPRIRRLFERMGL